MSQGVSTETQNMFPYVATFDKKILVYQGLVSKSLSSLQRRKNWYYYAQETELNMYSQSILFYI